MASIIKLLLISIVVLLNKSVLTVEICKQSNDEPPNSAFGFELMEQRMDSLQFSFMELFVHVKELGELITNNQRTIEQNQLETRLETNRFMHALEETLTTNVSLITSYSKKILDYQTICANHNEITKELSKLKPKLARSHNRQIQNFEVRSSSSSTSMNIENFEMRSTSSSTSIKSCKEANSTTSGVFVLPGVNGGEPFNVWCELKQFDGGWLVFQHRFNGSVSFYRNWTEYKNGFGDIGGEFWLGLEKIHQLTKEGQWELAIEMKDFQDNYKYARYSEFALGSESEKYALKKLGKYSGTADDHLSYHKGSEFSTYDSDNDGSSGNCAQTCQGAWWYNECYQSNLNGLHKNVQELTAIKWPNARPPLKYTRMMIRKV